jgi:hypothetical protein
VEIKIDELGFDERLFLPQGNTREWSANDRILLTLGNTKGIELKLNGEKIEIPETEGKIIRNFPLTGSSPQTKLRP